jgi:transposase-like protein
MHTMPRGKLRPTLGEVKALLAADRDFLRPIVEAVLQELLEAEMTEALGAAKGARTPDRLGDRAGYYGRTLVTRVGKLELRVPQDRAGRFSTELFERSQRAEKALVAALAEMSVQGGSTRKVKAITARLAASADLGGRRGAARCAAIASQRRRSARSTPGSTRSWPSSPAAASTRPAPT